MALTEKQEAFCAHYARWRSGPQAYMKAYSARDMLPASISSESHKLLKHPAITSRIAELTEIAAAASDVTLELKQIFEKLCLQIVTDPRELMVLRTGNCRYCNGEDFAYRWRQEEYQEALNKWQALAAKGTDPAINSMPDCAGGFGFRPFHPPNPECPECAGVGISHAGLKPTDEYSPGAAALFEGVKQTQHGIELKLADRGKALEMAIRMLGGFDDKLELKGQLSATLKAAIAVATDQHTAAGMYQEMLKAGG